MERNGRCGFGEKKGLTHMSLHLVGILCGKRKGDHNAPQPNELPGPHGHPDVVIAKICLWQ